MKKSTKGAVAAAGAAVVLLGGAGTLAYWNATATVSGGAIQTGELALTNASCATNWVLDSGEVTAGVAYVPGTTKLVPGDVITKTCTYQVTAVGEHLRATVTAPTPAALSSAFTVATPAVQIAGTPVTEITEANNGNTISVDLSVTFNGSSDNTTQNLNETLGSVTLTLQQAHN